jgi:hypothetical protein
MVFNGFFQALPQVVFGAFLPGNDVGMAMDYLGLSATAKWIAAAVAIAALLPIGALMARLLLGFGIGLVWVAILPALMALPLIIAFRVPREMLETVGYGSTQPRAEPGCNQPLDAQTNRRVEFTLLVCR